SDAIYVLSLHDALPISGARRTCARGLRQERPARGLRALCLGQPEPGLLERQRAVAVQPDPAADPAATAAGAAVEREARGGAAGRSEEHTSELQSREKLV